MLCAIYSSNCGNVVALQSSNQQNEINNTLVLISLLIFMPKIKDRFIYGGLLGCHLQLNATG